MSGAPVEVAVVDSRPEADLIVGLLRSNGLRAGISADDAGGTNPELQITGGVRVLVDPEDEADARQLIAEAQAGAEADDTSG
jgi:Putative prokaryotic signal transducing protein